MYKRQGLKAKGWTLWVESPTNQVFATVPNDVKPQIDAVCDYEDWCPYDESHTVIRFVTCFQTSQEAVSYTHLDVYKRQPEYFTPPSAMMGTPYSAATQAAS